MGGGGVKADQSWREAVRARWAAGGRWGGREGHEWSEGRVWRACALAA